MKNLLSAPCDFLHSFHGGKSSKRFWGNRLLTLGILMALVLYIANFITPFVFSQGIPSEVHDNIFDIISLFFYSGGGLLFGGVVEYFGKKK